MKKIITVLIGLGFIVAAYMYYEKPCYFVQPQRDHLICLLNNSKYHAIENYFSALQKAGANKTVTEDDIWNAFMIFESSDLNLEPYLEKWLLEYPDSFSANQAIGTFYEHLGWLSRGARWKKDTREDQLAGMVSYFNKAEEHFLRAAVISQESTLPYVGLIRMYKTSDKEKMKNAMLKGLEIDKTSYFIRYYYLFGLQPKWGGSTEELKGFFEETLSYSDENPKLKSLKGFLYFIIGDVKSYHDDDVKNSVIACKTSKSNLDRAIALSENPLFYSRRGGNNVCLKEYQDAIDDYSYALELDPESVPHRRGRGYAYGKLKQFKLALDDLNWAISRDPLNPGALVY